LHIRAAPYLQIVQFFFVNTHREMDLSAILGLINSNAALTGAALNPMLLRALALPSVYYFGELLDQPRVAAHVNGSTCREANLLRLFCSGTLAEYRAHADLYGAMEGPMLEKLKLLTLASLSASEREVTYASLRAALELPSDAEVEALVIKAIYDGLLEVSGAGGAHPSSPRHHPPLRALTHTHTHTHTHATPPLRAPRASWTSAPSACT